MLCGWVLFFIEAERILLDIYNNLKIGVKGYTCLTSSLYGNYVTECNGS